MKSVTKAEFFAYVGPRDVHPYPQYENGTIMSVWKLRNGDVIGKSYGHAEKATYYLKEGLV